jgi:hypothetical protein
MCAWADLAPILRSFTIGHIGGIMGHDCPSSEDHFCRDAREWRARSPDLLPGLSLQPLDRDQRTASPHHVRLSDLEPRFVCKACGKPGADVRPDFNWSQPPVAMMGYR